MATTLRPVPAARPDRPGTATTLELSESWSAVDAPAPALAAFSDGRSLSPAIETNIVLTATDPVPGGTLASWQAAPSAGRSAPRSARRSADCSAAAVALRPALRPAASGPCRARSPAAAEARRPAA